MIKFKCLKMTAPDGKKRMTDVVDTTNLLRLIQSIPSSKSEPFKMWLAEVELCRMMLEFEEREIPWKKL